MENIQLKYIGNLDDQCMRLTFNIFLKPKHLEKINQLIEQLKIILEEDSDCYLSDINLSDKKGLK